MSKALLKDIFEELDDIMVDTKPKAVLEDVSALQAKKDAQEEKAVQTAPQAPVDINEAMRKLKEIESDLNSTFYEREEAIKVMMVALISKMSVFFIGPPGTGKTDMTSGLCGRIVGGKYFSFLFNKTTDPSEVFGPFSLTAMERDQFIRKTKGFLPEAHIAYMDEIWKANSPILNLLLPILNEREFVNDGKKTKVPLMTAFASSNEFPEDRESLAAIYDRFVLRMAIEGIHDNKNVDKMMMDRVSRNNMSTLAKVPATISIDEIKALNEASMAVKVNGNIVKMLIKVQNAAAKKGGVFISDRKKNQCIDILQAYALYNGRGHVSADDLIILKYVFFDEDVPMDEIEQEILKLVDPYTDEVNKYYRQFNEIKNRIDSETDPTEKLKAIIEADKTMQQVITHMANAIGKAQKSGKNIDEFTKKRDEISNYRNQMIQSALGGANIGSSTSSGTQGYAVPQGPGTYTTGSTDMPADVFGSVTSHT